MVELSSEDSVAVLVCMGLTPVEARLGRSVRVHSEDLLRKKVLVNGATVVTPDVEAGNAVFHIIDP